MLFLHDISGGEILLVMIFVLIFFGAKSIPGIARSLGKGFHQIRQASDELKSEIRNSSREIQSDFRKQEGYVQRQLDKATKEVEEPLKELNSDD